MKMETGEMIKKLRMQNHWTQEQLGEKLGVQKSAIAKYEKGRVENLKRSTIQKMAEIFNVSPLVFLGYEVEERPNKQDIRLKTICNKLSSHNLLNELFDKVCDLTDNDIESVMMFVDTIRKQRGIDE